MAKKTKTQYRESPRKSEFRVLPAHSLRLATLKNLSEDLLSSKEKSAKYKAIYFDANNKPCWLFPSIPKDLKNKSVNIRYKQWDWRYHNVYLYEDWIKTFSEDGKQDFEIDKIKDSWNAHSTGRERGLCTIEPFDSYSFYDWIYRIINNADKCEITIEELKHKRI